MIRLDLPPRLAPRPASGIRKRNYFAGAAVNRLNADWLTGAASPTMELWGSLAKMRERARDLERNNPLVRRYLHLVAENIIGHKGLRLQCRNTLPDGRPNTQANTSIETAFAEWHRPATCTVEGRLSWVGFQQLVMKTVARDGEAFVRIVEPFPPYGIALQLIDADLIDETYNRAGGKGTNAIRLGIEVDRWGRSVAYHVFPSHQHDVTGGRGPRVRVAAAEMLHLFIPRRPGQTRGESWLAPVMMPLRMLDGYAEAELVAARTAAAKMGFITKGENYTAGAGDADDGRQKELEAAPGIIEELDLGEGFQAWDPTHPSGNFPAFVVQIEKIIAGGMNVAYSSLTGDLREVNYSSIRAGLLQERDGWRGLQTFCAEQLCEPVYDAWRDVAWKKGHLTLRMAPHDYGAHVWQPRGWAWIDPEKDVRASAMAVAFGFTSPQRIVGEDGNDYEDILTEISVANALAESLDVSIMVPEGVSNGNTGAEGTTDANATSGSGGAGDTGRGGRAHPPLAVVRAAC